MLASYDARHSALSSSASSGYDSEQDIKLPPLTQSNKVTAAKHRKSSANSNSQRGMTDVAAIAQSYGLHTNDNGHEEITPLSAKPVDKKIPIRRVDSQKTITFYRHRDDTEPALRMVLSKKKYKSLLLLIKELSRILSLDNEDDRIMRWDGKLLKKIDDFEDGESYFFGRLESDDNPSYHSSTVSSIMKSQPGSNPTTAGSAKRHPLSDGTRAAKKARLISVVTNQDSSHPWSVFVDETKLDSLQQFIEELNELIKPREGRIHHICTITGRRIRGIPELFYGDDKYVAVISSVGVLKKIDETSNDGEALLERELTTKELIERKASYGLIRGGYSYHSVHINAAGKLHVFDAPVNYGYYRNILQIPKSAPDQKLGIEWIYGYNGYKSRNNVFLLHSGEIVYYVASAAIIFDAERRKQRYYTEHTEEILCMALHPNKWYVATGQAPAGYPNTSAVDHIRIWNTDYLNTLSVLSLDEQHLSVVSLAFSSEDNGKKLASLDTDGHSQRLLVWEWLKKDIVARSESYEDPELQVVFHPHQNRTLMTIGKEHVYHWTWRGNYLEKLKGHFFGCEKPAYVNCLTFLSTGDAVTGDSDGNLQIWKKGSRQTKHVIKAAHKGSIESLHVLSRDILVTYGAEDRTVALWETADMKNFKSPFAVIAISEDYGDVISISSSEDPLDEDIGNIPFYLGTNKNCILHGTLKTQFLPFVKGHSGETTSLDVHPAHHQFITAGTDANVTLWSSEECIALWDRKIEYKVTSAVFSPLGNVIAVGTNIGRWSVLSTEDGSHLASFQSGKDPITCLAYSSDAADIAVGTASGEIYLYAVYDDGNSYRLIASFQNHPNPIVSFDWSKNSLFLRSVTDIYDLTVWNIETVTITIDPFVIRDIDWDSQKSVLGYQTAGIWPPEYEDLLITSCDRSKTRDLLCAGTEMGHVRLSRYPCPEKMTSYHEYKIHVSSINKIAFSSSSLQLLTAGRHDHAIIQWRITLGDAHEQGTGKGYFKPVYGYDRIHEDKPSDEIADSPRTSTYTSGHRRVRKQDSLVSPRTTVKQTSIKNLDQDYYNKPAQMDQSQMQDYLAQTGRGMSGREVALERSQEFVAEDKNRRRQTSAESRTR